MACRDRVGHEEANKISRQAAGRGTAVHAMCESYVNNDPNYAKDAMPNILNDFNRIKDILDTRIGTVYGQEVPLYSSFNAEFVKPPTPKSAVEVWPTAHRPALAVFSSVVSLHAVPL